MVINNSLYTKVGYWIPNKVRLSQSLSSNWGKYAFAYKVDTNSAESTKMADLSRKEGIFEYRLKFRELLETNPFLNKIICHR